MGAPTPQTLLEAIAADAATGGSPGDKTFPMPDAPTGTNAASIQEGFPAITMQSELAGGEPPLGQDMNGYLFLITSHTLWVECGQLYQFNAALATAIGGYLAGSILGMADGTGAWLCVSGPNSANPDTGGAGWVPISAYGKTTVPVTGGTVTLTAAQSKYGVIILTGVLASNLNLQLPQNIQEWLIINNTSNAGAGTFTTTATTSAAGSSGVTCPQGGFTSPTGVYSVGDGNIYPTVAPLSVPIDQNPTPLTLVERTNAGYVLATYFNSNQGVDNDTAATVVTTRGDGFYRQNSLTNFEAQMLISGIAGQLVNGQVPYSVVAQWATTFFNSATLTGNPTAPTAGLGISNTQIATTAFANPASSATNPGYIQFPNGWVLNFGRATATGVSNVTDINVSFAKPFTTIFLAAAVCTRRSVAVNGQASSGSNFVSNEALGGMTVSVDVGNPGGGANTASGYWWALGK